MPFKSSRPMKLCGWVSSMRLLIVWLVFSFNRLSRWPSMIRRLVALRVPFRLQPLLEAGVMVSLRSHFLSTIELCAVVQGGYGCQVALADIDAHNAGVAFWCGVGRLKR